MSSHYNVPYRAIEAGSANMFHTLTSPVPSPVKNRPPGPTWIDRTSCFEKIFPLSENLRRQNRIKKELEKITET